MSHEGYHEPVQELSDRVRDMHRAIESLREEFEAVDWYNQRVATCKDPELRDILQHNANEEKEHAGEFLRLLQVLAPDEQGFYDEGMGETNEKIEKLKGSCKSGQCSSGKDAH